MNSNDTAKTASLALGRSPYSKGASRLQADLEKPVSNAEHAAAWEALAKEQDEIGTEPAKARAITYRRTAESFRLEDKTGFGHCTCCLRPFGSNRSSAGGAK